MPSKPWDSSNEQRPEVAQGCTVLAASGLARARAAGGKEAQRPNPLASRERPIGAIGPTRPEYGDVRPPVSDDALRAVPTSRADTRCPTRDPPSHGRSCVPSPPQSTAPAGTIH